MRSIKGKSDLAKVIDFLLKGIDLNIETIKKHPGNSSFPSFKLDDYNPFQTKKADDNSTYSYVEDDESDYYSETASSNVVTDDYIEETAQTSQDRIDQRVRRPSDDIDSYSTSRRFSKDVSRDRLREAIIWSEILDSPVSKRRHIRTRGTSRYKKS